MKYFLLFVAVVALSLSGCALLTQERRIGPLKHFHDPTFGSHFSYSAGLSLDPTPGDGRDSVVIRLHEETIGWLKVRPSPSAGEEEEFIARLKRKIEDKHLDSSVTVTSGHYKNPQAYNFYHIKAKGLFKGKKYMVEQFTYLHPRPTPPTPQNIFGAYTFLFLYQEEDNNALKQEILTIIDSFRVERPPDP